uniref:ERC protein 2 n=1 Tax=Macrostomum lignano TaxID=282301 RepID=A0A1I8H159_9PLAT
FQNVTGDPLELLTPEEVAELKRRRISTQIQLDCLLAEIKKRQRHLSPQQMQTLNAQMSDLREDIQEMSATISRLDRDAERAAAAEGSNRKKGSL